MWTLSDLLVITNEQCLLKSDNRVNTFAIQREARGLFCGRIEPSVGMA